MKQQMIERRRDKLTLNWRPAGAPARRVDDFAEVPHRPQVPPAPARSLPVAERDVVARIENWVRWATEPERMIAISGTGKAIERAKREAGIAEDATNERRQVDEPDALLIERRLTWLRGTQRTALRMHYIRCIPWQQICRMLQVPVRKQNFDALLATAHAELERLLKTDQRK